MHKNFAMMVTPPKRKNQEPKRTRTNILPLEFGSWFFLLVSHRPAEACPPPCMNTTNELQPFGHRRGKKLRRARCARLLNFLSSEFGLGSQFAAAFFSPAGSVG